MKIEMKKRIELELKGKDPHKVNLKKFFFCTKRKITNTNYFIN